MSDIFKASVQKKKRNFGDWLFDNLMWVMLVAFLVAVGGFTGTAIFVLLHGHEIAREAGSLARSASDGYSNSNHH